MYSLYHSRLIFLSFRKIPSTCGSAPVRASTGASLRLHSPSGPRPRPRLPSTAPQTAPVDGKSRCQLWALRNYGHQEEENTTLVGAVLSGPQTSSPRPTVWPRHTSPSRSTLRPQFVLPDVAVLLYTHPDTRYRRSGPSFASRAQRSRRLHGDSLASSTTSTKSTLARRNLVH